MNELKISTQLTQLIEASKEIGDKRNPPFTAERFLVAIIDKMNDGDNYENDVELSTAFDFINESIGDLNSAKESLMAYICQEKSTLFLDDLYMKKKLQEASKLVLETNGSEVDTVALILCIARDPSVTIKSVLKADTAKEETKSDTNASIEEQVAALAARLGEIVEHNTQKTADVSRTDAKKDTTTETDERKTQRSVKSDMAELVSEVKRIRSELHDSIYGQDNAINVFVTGYFQASMLSMIDKSRRRPKATFLFAGPPGVGKTFLAEKAAEALKLPFMRFDMSEYCDKEAAIEFCGSDGVYKNNKQGNFTSFVNENPKCVVLLDEIEKAHISIIHLFLQVLDAGRLRDNNTDNEISFKDTILIFTTNAGKQLYKDSEDGDLSAISRKVILNALEKDVNPETGVPYFPGAMCSRFASGNVVMFNHMGAHNLRSIAKKEIERHADNLQNEMDISIEIDDLVYTALLLSEGAKADARTIRSRAEAFFNDEMYELFRLVSSSKANTTIDEIEKIKVCVDVNGLSENISSLFTLTETQRALILSDKETVSLCASKKPLCEIIGVQTSKDAIDVIKSKDIDLIILDVKFGLQENSSMNLNIEDINSPARELLHILHEQRNATPVYLLEHGKNSINEEEKISFTRQGVRGFLNISKANNDKFAAALNDILSVIHQQASIIKLARENKLVTFETSQRVSKNGKTATIQLFDFKATVAVDSEDAKSILSAVSKPDVHFDDVIGAEDAKQELTYFVEYLKNPKKYMGTGVKAPKGVILYGPPGTGKTMLAKAMACEAGVTFIAAEGNQFLKKYVGEGPEKVHELFKTARKYAPAILFIDEIDAIAKERKGGEHAGANGEDTLTAFLAEMDGFVNNPSKPVFVLAATNFDVEPGRDKSLDPALMRRFDRRVYMDLPTKEDRIKFLKMKIAKNHALDISDSQIDNISMRATGMSLAELDSVVELALRSAIREGSTVVNDAILEEAFETFNSGEVKKWDASQLERVAKHEAGHALLCWLSGETPSYLTIVARGNHGGYMQHAEQEGKAIYTKEELLARIRTALGGRAAEIAYYGECDGISTGASGDLSSATNIAQQIVCTYGMDDEFGLAVVHGAVAANGTMSVEVRTSVNRILREQMAEAVRLINENKDKIDSLVEELMSKNHLNGEEINLVLSKGGLKAADK